MFELTQHRDSSASVHDGADKLIHLARWYRGNPISASFFSLTPAEARRIAAMLVEEANIIETRGETGK